MVKIVVLMALVYLTAYRITVLVLRRQGCRKASVRRQDRPRSLSFRPARSGRG